MGASRGLDPGNRGDRMLNGVVLGSVHRACRASAAGVGSSADGFVGGG